MYVFDVLYITRLYSYYRRKNNRAILAYKTTAKLTSIESVQAFRAGIKESGEDALQQVTEGSKST